MYTFYWYATVSGVCRRLSSVVDCNNPQWVCSAGGFTRASQVMTLFRLQSNYSSTVSLHGGPVKLRPVRATPCYFTPCLFTTRNSIKKRM